MPRSDEVYVKNYTKTKEKVEISGAEIFEIKIEMTQKKLNKFIAWADKENKEKEN